MKKKSRIHPGEVLLKEFIIPSNPFISDLSKSIGLPIHILEEILYEQRGIISEEYDIPSKFAARFGTTEAFWIGLQKKYDSEVSKDKNKKITTKG